MHSALLSGFEDTCNAFCREKVKVNRTLKQLNLLVSMQVNEREWCAWQISQQKTFYNFLMFAMLAKLACCRWLVEHYKWFL